MLEQSKSWRKNSAHRGASLQARAKTQGQKDLQCLSKALVQGRHWQAGQRISTGACHCFLWERLVYNLLLAAQFRANKRLKLEAMTRRPEASVLNRKVSLNPQLKA